MTPKDFHHPYEPYPIQQEFMSAMYQCIEGGKVGIFESPTGTGKSLSLICGSLTWLREHKRKELNEELDEVEDEDEPDWILEHARKEKRQAVLQCRKDLEARLAKVRGNERKLKDCANGTGPLTKRRKIAANDQTLSVLDAEEFVLDDYESEPEANLQRSFTTTSHGLSAETEALMKKLGLPFGTSNTEVDTDTVDELKVFYSSRTHSQLSQFSNELRRVQLPPAVEPDPPDPPEVGRGTSSATLESVKYLTLGSRKNLCINPKVNKLGSATAINEKCLELQRSAATAECKCSFLPTKDTEALVNDFRDHALADIRDIEDLGAVGRKLGICPYYASRPAIRPCEIVTLPYPLLLQKSAREALNLSLKDHIVIIDEAHNLMDAITGIYSISVSLAQLQRGRGQLQLYLQKFRNRLAGKNRVYVTQTARLLDSLISYSLNKTSEKSIDGLILVGDLMTGKGVDQINLYKLSRYLQDSKLARKIDGYILHTEEEANAAANKTALASSNRANQPAAEVNVPVLTHIQGFLLALMNPSAEGRFFYSISEGGTGLVLKYLLLDPTQHFKEIVEEARAVILAGGTMSPMSDYSSHLFSYIRPSQIMTLSCGHVIPPSNLIAWPVAQDAKSADFDFTFTKRNSEVMINSTGQTLLSFILNIPDGVVVFFPSYAYLDQCVKAWKEPVQGVKSIWEQISAVKPVFLEPRSNPAATDSKPTKAGSAATEALLTSYSNVITNSNDQRGALLLSVINGSLSEGINFSDRLGRAVIVIGLPFSNAHSAEWKAKLEYIKQKASTAANENKAAGKAAATEFYENATMRAVNQAIGRAIRHKGDYAAILLIDRRYSSDRIQGKLPGWIKGSLKGHSSVDNISTELREFFASKNDLKRSQPI